MSAVDFLKTTKGKAISIGGVAVLAIGILIVVLLQGNGYRSIAVEQVEGNVIISGEKNAGQAYVGEHLYSGDDVTVMDQALLTMCMDNDKYVYADANTHFTLEASGAKEDSRIKINLDEGSELNELQNKLGPNDVYEVDTPNSTMSVRGTKYRVTTFETSYGIRYTLVEVEEGEVLIRLKAPDGSYTGEEKILKPGQSALVRSDFEKSEFIPGDRLNESKVDRNGSDGEGMLVLTYDALPKDGMERLIKLIMDIEVDEKSDDPGAKTNTESDETDVKTDSDMLTGDASDSSKTTPAPEPTKHVHKAGDWITTVQAGCLTEGKAEQKCTECGEILETKMLPATGHISGDWVYLGYPTCTDPGAKQLVCANCGEVLETETVPATGHSWSGWDGGSEPTCTSGSTKTRSCSECGLTESESESALGHDWVESGRHYFQEGQDLSEHGQEITYRCSRCGETRTEKEYY